MTDLGFFNVNAILLVLVLIKVLTVFKFKAKKKWMIWNSNGEDNSIRKLHNQTIYKLRTIQNVIMSEDLTNIILFLNRYKIMYVI